MPKARNTKRVTKEMKGESKEGTKGPFLWELVIAVNS